jgi:hypothetical protein
MKARQSTSASLIILTAALLLGLLLGCTGQPDTPEVRRPASGEDLEAFWDAFDWSELTPTEQELWGVLGWDEASWQGEADEPASEEMDWSELSADQQRAAEQLGYDQAYWDAVP